MFENAVARLLQERTSKGHWEGQLSTSALSTATALFALHLHDARRHSQMVQAGIRWLIEHQNDDGGWGDTVLSLSNISTTALCWAALSVEAPSPPTPLPLGERGVRTADALQRCEAWLTREAGSLQPKALAAAIVRRYGKDRTFSVPILTMLALAGRVGWKLVPQLPFELAALPFRFFQTIRLPVVSYALPALIAIGLVRHVRRPSWNPLTRPLRSIVRQRTLRKLLQIQPTSGGYLEAAPLTSFVLMSLIGAGERDHPVVDLGVEFLLESFRDDGSWPIDTNLATWVTTLSVNAVAPNSQADGPENQSPRIDNPLSVKQFLLQQQYRTIHPYTHAPPGGWAWTDLPGGVPDADDTPGALLALLKLGNVDDVTIEAATAGITWLLNLQNGDGGIPTFCKGWTGLPFDRSSNDLTAHTLLAWDAWKPHLCDELRQRIVIGTQRGINYLLKSQQPDGAWAPLWFGNQHGDEVANLTYGTSRVLRLAGIDSALSVALQRGQNWLIDNQNPDGGWGGRGGTPSSIEETALALEGLAAMPELAMDSIERGVAWLEDATRNGTRFPPTPIGFYFANLWYYEKLYPIIFTVAALSALREKAL